MNTLSKKEFQKLAKKYELIPVTRELLADTLTPVSVLSTLQKKGDCFLLESISGGENVSRYSFLGCGKSRFFICYGEEIEIIEGRSKKKYHSKDPIGELDRYTTQLKYADLPDLPIFGGGGVGYISYDSFRTVEDLPDCPVDDLGMPDILFCFPEILLTFDHAKRLLSVTSFANLKEEKVNKAYEKAHKGIDRIVSQLKKVDSLPLLDSLQLKAPLKLKFKSNVTKAKYKKSVEILKEHIKAGDIFQAVLSQRLEADCKASPINIYRALRALNPSPYMFYLKFSDFHLLGASPEILVSVDKGRKITVRPIAGTRPRGKDAEEDAELVKDLMGDAKEVSEHTMLVDLARNDLGRVSDYKSIEIEENMIVEFYSHVMHIVSTVSGTLPKKLKASDSFKACFPAGTLSGAPKIKAMSILDNLETTKRGPYGGGVGYLDYRGHMDTCIAIRSILLKDGKAFVQSGAGIVADSVPENEYLETLNKAKALLKAIEVAECHF